MMLFAAVAVAVMPWSGSALAQVAGTPVTSDTPPPDFAPPTHQPLAGGGGQLWSGGERVFPADPNGSAGDGSQVYRGVAAVLQAPRPTCDSGTVTIDFSVRVTNNGPANGAGYAGRLSLFGDGGTTVLGETGLLAPPAGSTTIVTLSQSAAAAALAAGDLVVGLWLETFHAGSKAWTADQFAVSHAYDTAGCEADLAITKDNGVGTYAPGFDSTYTIVVTNDGPSDVTGARVTDPLPAGIVSANWTCGSATGGGVCGQASGTGAIDTNVDLPAGASVTYALSIAVPASHTGNLTNTATVTAPDGVVDANLDNNTASDTDTMEPPPTSGACAPRRVAGNTTFSLAPFAITGTVQKSGAPNGWNASSPWSTLGGNYTFTWTFAQPVPANWIRFAVSDVGHTAYQTTPARFGITLGAGSTATPSDFSLVAGWHPTFSDMNYNASAGVLTFVPSGETKQAGALQGNSTDMVTSITITATNVNAADHIVNLLYVRPSCLTLEKVSEGDTGAFTIEMTNVAEADGTVVPSTTLTTTTPGTPAAAAMLFFSPVPGAVMSLSEDVPQGWDNTAGMCTDQNAGVTGNPTVIGSFASPTIAIPAENVRPEADIHCRFTNTALPSADLGIVKTVAPQDTVTGDEVVYALELANNGPEAADGAIVTDPGVPDSLECTALACSAAGGAVCPAEPTPAQLATGLVIPIFPNGGTVSLELTCTVTASGN